MRAAAERGVRRIRMQYVARVRRVPSGIHNMAAIVDGEIVADADLPSPGRANGHGCRHG
jgi:hypothetical protein